MGLCNNTTKVYKINDNYKTWVELTNEATSLMDNIETMMTSKTGITNTAATNANTAASTAITAAASVGTELDKTVFVDEDENVKFNGKFRIIDGNPSIRCTEL